VKTINEEQKEKIETILRETLPHGSGIDARWGFSFNAYNRVFCRNSFHKMDENGFYCGWDDFTLTIDLDNFTFKITGGKKQYDYLWETFNYWFSKNKKPFADIVGVSLIPREDRRLIEINLQGWRADIIKRHSHYGDWPQWAKDVSTKINDLCMDLDNYTDYGGK
jgi:hypothetical protein